MKNIFYILLCTVTPTVHLLSKKNQKKIKINYQAEKLQNGIINNEKCKQLLGNVVFKHEETYIYADNAYFFDHKNTIQAEDNVKIVTNNGATVITANHLIYNTQEKKAQLRHNVTYTSEESSLYTDNLDYDYTQKIAYFFDGGKLIQKDNCLQSTKGYYYEKKNMAKFYDQVHFENQEYALECATLFYNTKTHIAYFRGKTTIHNHKEKTTMCIDNGGEYNTKTEKSNLKRSTIENEKYSLTANNLTTNKDTQIHTAVGNVVMIDKENNITIFSQNAKYAEKKGEITIHGNILVSKKITEEKNDILYFTAKKIICTQHTSTKKYNTITAKGEVQFYTKNLQGVANTMEFHPQDNKIIFSQDPILWNNKSQMSAKKIIYHIKEKKIDKVLLEEQAFIVDTEDQKNYNQMKGRKIEATIANNAIKKLTIDGNGEAIYFATDNNTLSGLNYITCSHMDIHIQSQKIAEITFHIKPEAIYKPYHLIKKEHKQLDGFNWFIDKKPTKKKICGIHYKKKPYHQFKFYEKK